VRDEYRSAWPRRAGAAAALVLLAATPAIVAETTAPDRSVPTLRALAAASAWSDSLESYRVPELPPPGPTESAIVLLKDPPAAWASPGRRGAAAAADSREQAAVEPLLAGLGATIHFHYRILVNGFGIELPVGRLGAVAALPEVRAIVPVTYLAPAAAQPAGSGRTPAYGTTAQPTTVPAPPPGVAPQHLALIDAGVDAGNPWLGGGMGPTFPIVGGADVVDGDADPSANAADAAMEAHGTELAGLVLRSPALQGLAPGQVPRLLVYRVVAPEVVDGRTRPLARTDRVLAALEDAVDPNGDGDTSDRASVILLGLARGFAGGGVDPVARALKAADRVGSVVVVPSGNDGPSFGPAGTVGGPAAAGAVISVGGVSADTTPRTGSLDVLVGPAAAGLQPLPLMGADPTGQPARVVMVTGPDGVASGDALGDFVDANGVSRVQGAIAVVARSGAPIAQKARNAAAAGAVGLAVWDEAGSGVFPGPQGGADWPLPVVGLGPSQGEALAAVVRSQPDLLARITANPVGPASPAIASFSSRGPTAAGRLKPDLVAPAVNLLTAYPGVDAGGQPLTTHLSGTSGAAAEVAAEALRIRIDHPELLPSDVRSILVQSARPVPGAAAADEGAGEVGPPPSPPVAVDPPIVSGVRPASGDAEVAFALHDLTGFAHRYRLVVAWPGGRSEPLGAPIRVAAGVRAGVRLRVPAGRRVRVGRLLVLRPGGGPPVATAPVYFARRAHASPNALGVPRVRVAGGIAEVRVDVGRLDRVGGWLQSTPLHAVSLWLVPAGGRTPLRLSGAKEPGDWPAGSYRFLLARRLANGARVPSGRWRLRVTASGPDGTPLRRDSAPFVLG
jgi:hypothetical protein